MEQAFTKCECLHFSSHMPGAAGLWNVCILTAMNKTASGMTGTDCATDMQSSAALLEDDTGWFHVAFSLFFLPARLVSAGKRKIFGEAEKNGNSPAAKKRNGRDFRVKRELGEKYQNGNRNTGIVPINPGWNR